MGTCDFCREREATELYCPDVPMTLGACRQCVDMVNIRTWHWVNNQWFRGKMEAIERYKSFYDKRVYVYWHGEYIEISDYCRGMSEDRLREQYDENNAYQAIWLQKFLKLL